MNFWTGLLVGLGSGLIIFPICLSLFLLIKNTLERRKVKKLIMKGQFLAPIDLVDYDSKAWAQQIKHDPEYLKSLDAKIFNRELKEAAKTHEN